VHVAVTHALMAEDAHALMAAAGIDQIWSSNSIVHPSNVLSLAPLLTQGLRQIYKPA
jgi:ribose-phosphate pyrophosphokinase